MELLSFGVMNTVGSFFGIYPTFGSLPRSRVLANSLGRTTLVNAMAGVGVLLSMMYLEGILRYLPKATLGSIVFVAAVGLIEVKEIAFVFKSRYKCLVYLDPSIY